MVKKFRLDESKILIMRSQLRDFQAWDSHARASQGRQHFLQIHECTSDMSQLTKIFPQIGKDCHRGGVVDYKIAYKSMNYKVVEFYSFPVPRSFPPHYPPLVLTDNCTCVNDTYVCLGVRIERGPSFCHRAPPSLHQPTLINWNFRNYTRNYHRYLNWSIYLFIYLIGFSFMCSHYSLYVSVRSQFRAGLFYLLAILRNCIEIRLVPVSES